MGDKAELYKERAQRMEVVQKGGKPDRVPVYSLVDNWAFAYAGYSIEEAFADDSVHLDAFLRVGQDFFWDCMFTSCTSRAMNYVDALGGGSYRTNGVMQFESGSAMNMTAEEYKDLIADQFSFIRDVVGPRKYQLLRQEYSQDKYEKYVQAIDLYLRSRKLVRTSVERFREQLGLPIARSTTFIHPVDILLDFLRDFKGITMDIKRNPAMVAAAAEAMTPTIIELAEAAYPEHIEGKSIFNPMHLPQFLQPKDFENVYWPSYKKIVEHFAAKGCVVQSYFERDYSHLYDYLQDLPKGAVLGLFENDDLRLTKEKLGSVMCIAGGMSVFTLNYGSKEECLSMAARLLDELAPGGGYIFTTNRIVHSENDAKAENLRAVNDFVREQGVYR